MLGIFMSKLQSVRSDAREKIGKIIDGTAIESTRSHNLFYRGGKKRCEADIASDVLKLQTDNFFAHKTDAKGNITGKYRHPALEEAIRYILQSVAKRVGDVSVLTTISCLPPSVYAEALTLVSHSDLCPFHFSN